MSAEWGFLTTPDTRYVPIKVPTSMGGGTAYRRLLPAGLSVSKPGVNNIPFPMVSMTVHAKGSKTLHGVARFTSRKDLSRLNGRGYNIGWTHNARYIQKKYKDEQGKKRFNRVVASKVAYWLEFGNRGGKQPARPFMKKAGDHFHPVLVQTTAEWMHKNTVRASKGTLRNFVACLNDTQIGALAKIHKKIIQDILRKDGNKYEPNAPSTIRLKKKKGTVGGKIQPLLWTGYLAKKVAIFPKGGVIIKK